MISECPGRENKKQRQSLRISTVNGVTDSNRVLGADHCMPPGLLLGVLRWQRAPQMSQYAAEA